MAQRANDPALQAVLSHNVAKELRHGTPHLIANPDSETTRPQSTLKSDYQPQPATAYAAAPSTLPNAGDRRQALVAKLTQQAMQEVQQEQAAALQPQNEELTSTARLAYGVGKSLRQTLLEQQTHTHSVNASPVSVWTDKYSQSSFGLKVQDPEGN